MKNNFQKMVMILFIILAFSAISPAEDFIINVQVKLKDVCVEKARLRCTVSKTKNEAGNYTHIIASHIEPVPKTGDGCFELTKAISFSANEGKNFRQGKAYYCRLDGLIKGQWIPFINLKESYEFCVYSKDSAFNEFALSVFEKDTSQNQNIHTLVGSLPVFEATGTSLPNTEVTTPEFYATGERNEQ